MKEKEAAEKAAAQGRAAVAKAVAMLEKVVAEQADAGVIERGMDKNAAAWEEVAREKAAATKEATGAEDDAATEEVASVGGATAVEEDASGESASAENTSSHTSEGNDSEQGVYWMAEKDAAFGNSDFNSVDMEDAGPTQHELIELKEKEQATQVEREREAVEKSKPGFIEGEWSTLVNVCDSQSGYKYRDEAHQVSVSQQHSRRTGGQGHRAMGWNEQGASGCMGHWGGWH